jgi:hypothetical protein
MQGSSGRSRILQDAKPPANVAGVGAEVPRSARKVLPQDHGTTRSLLLSFPQTSDREDFVG